MNWCACRMVTSYWDKELIAPHWKQMRKINLGKNNVQFQKKNNFKKQSFLTAVFFLLESKISFELNLSLLNIYTQ